MTPDMIRRAAAQGDARDRDHARPARLRLQEQGRAAAARRRRRLPAEPARRAAGARARPATEHELDAARRPEGAVLGARLQGHVRPVRRQAHLLPRLLRARSRPATASSTRPPAGPSAIGRILQMHANHREEREEIGAGEIAAAVGLKATTTGDTLATDTAPILLESMTFPEPVIAVAIEPKTKADQDKLAAGPRSASPRRTRPSACAPTRRPARRSSPAWASCTSRSSSTASCASSRSTRTSAARRSPTARRSASRAEKIQGRFVRQTGGRASTATP